KVDDEASLKKALRRLRSRVMLRVIVRDLCGLGDLQEVMHSMTALAETSVQFALQHLTAWQEAVYGSPIGESGAKQDFIVVGMGKLGGGELNVSSDVDLIFAYEEDGETNGPKVISNFDFFVRLAKKLIAAIDEITEDGFVFRVDMRLRPYGSDGPLASSFAMLEEYYQNQGREWERYAWIKGRIIAGPGHNLAKLLRPFVFRKYLDYGAFASMRDLKIQIQRDVNRRDMHDNIKLGRGGIREIEFIAQVFQLIRGGRDMGLQIRSTLSVLQALQNKGLLPAETVQQLQTAYVFLRNLEHRLQYLDDAQTQDLPISQEHRARIALGMGYASWDELLPVLEQHRAAVQLHFDEVFHDPAADKAEHNTVAEIWQGVVPEEEALNRLQVLGYMDAPETRRRLQSLHTGGRYRQLPEPSRQRFDALMPLVITQAAQEASPDSTLMRVSDLLSSICRRASYLALLAEYPGALSLVIKLAGASPWLVQYLTQHPLLLDELLDTRNLYALPDFDAMRAELRKRLAEAEGDVERQMDIMRHFKHAAVFRFAAKDVAGELRLEKLSDCLSALADLILQATIETLWPSIRGRHRDDPQFAIIGYGKLGGKELGYASDLDIIFLYDDEMPGVGEVYVRLAQRISTWLNSQTSAGMLYETDLALRPNGSSGLLVSTLSAFRDYQQNQAWVWEHQALTRARYCAGSPDIGAAFENIRREVLTQKRDLAKLRAEVLAMREKMHGGHPNASELFDLKHNSGGIVDVEFMVQYLVLAHAHQHPQLTANIGNIALLELLGELGLLDKEKAEQVAGAYRLYRRLQHAIRLQGEGRARVPLVEVAPQVEAVQDLWAEVFGLHAS
ncbi:MAG TPA: bifunctional [glutamate--ammonia ligase]-adenylyl-L-tyrosine phosphorylase/[glutamate--ammonia-ligase] adenylyltransferase, partial [Methylophilaceae bacterium]|nr:bifunctional [glutamate--ammonia ligase]-adenylyl-L-tyrosine phosphorylase/[glutamate--ammonia-ligase] adenylyltransferase [Methylophilaceae bacterium]